MSCGTRVAAGKKADAAQQAATETMESRFQAFQKTLPASIREKIMAPSDGENRMVTVLFADMSGSVATTAGLEPEAAAELVNGLLRAMVDVFSRFEARIDRFLGDGALAVFGTPHAHEDDPERAVLAAMEIRARAHERGLEVSVGINTGLVYFGSMGADEHHELTVMGAVVNLAARLQSKAGAGNIVIGDSTYCHVMRSFELAPLSLDVKGFKDKVTAYLVVRQRPRMEKARGLEGMRAELIGREEEFSKLAAALAEAKAGTGRMVSLIGEAGVGKSRLVAELREHALPKGCDGDGMLWLEGRCLELGVTAAYWPFIDMLGQHIGLPPVGGEGERAQRLTGMLEGLRDSGGLSAERVEEMGPLLGKLFSVRFGTEWDQRLAHAQPEQVKHQTFLALRDLLLAFSKGCTLVVVLDDLHWADSLSIDVISLLMESLTLAPILLVCVYRPEREQRCWQLATVASRKCPERYLEITLRELTPSQSRRLINSLLSVEALPPAVRDAIQTQSQGNPFYVEEVVRSLIEIGVVYREGDRWHAKQDAPPSLVPQTLQSVIMSRVDRLDADLRHVLESASVIGRIFRCRVLERAAAEEQAVEEMLGRLQDCAMIYEENAVPEMEYSFKHVLTQQTVYQSILRRRRGLLHGRIAEAIEALYHSSLEEYCEQLAYHYEKAGNTTKAVEYLLRAGEKERDAYMNEEASARFRHVIELSDGSDGALDREKLRALFELGRVYETAGKHGQSEAMLREAADLGRKLGISARELAEILYFLVKAITARHRPEEYLPLVRECLELLADDPGSADYVRAEFVLGYAAFESGIGDLAEICSFSKRRGALVRSLPYSQEMAINAGYLAWAHFVDKDDVLAEHWLGWLDTEAHRHNDLLTLAAIQVRRGRDGLAPKGDRRGAVEAMEKAISLYHKAGGRYLEARCYLYQGDIEYRYGKIPEAEECRARAASIARELGTHPHLAAEVDLLRGQIELSRGDPKAALSAFQDALASSPGENWRYLLRFLEGRALLDLGQREKAEDLFRGLLESAPPFHVPPAYSLTMETVHVLGLLDECLSSEADFRTACYLLRKKRPQDAPLLMQWYLEPCGAGADGEAVVEDRLTAEPGTGWTWVDPFGDCAKVAGDGLLMSAPVGRGLGAANLSAPRLLRKGPGAFHAQVEVEAGVEGTPAAGGIVLWKDPAHYIRLDRGSLGADHICFGGCHSNRDRIVGRGRLPAGRLFLRLESSSGKVRALCSRDGKEWFTVGESEFPSGDPPEVGLFVDGALRPEIYPRGYPQGSAVRFREFGLFRA